MHFHTLCGLLACKIDDEKDLENAYERSFIFKFGNCKILWFSGTNDVKYADVGSEVQSFTIVLRITGGRDSIISPLLLLFQKKLELFNLSFSEQL